MAISRRVSFSEAVYGGEKEVQGVAAKLIKFVSEIPKVWTGNKLPIIVDPDKAIIDTLRPDILIDAIMAKMMIFASMAIPLAGLTDSAVAD